MYTKIFALLLTCLFIISAKAQPPDAIIIDAAKTTHITIAADLQVMLVQATGSTRLPILNNSAKEQLQITWHNSDLDIAANNSYKGAMIYVIVEDIHSLTLGSNALLQTAGSLSAAEINVYVDEYAKAILKTSGKVHGYGLGGQDVDIKVKPSLSPAIQKTKGK